MKRFRLRSLALGLLPGTLLYGQKMISEGTLIYDITIQSGATLPQKGDAHDGASKTVYLKGSSSRTEQVTFLGKETNIHDGKSGNAVILKEFSGQKLMITLNKDNWSDKNMSVGKIKFELDDETKTVAGFTAKRATGKTGDGNKFTVWYAPDLQVANKDYDLTFAMLPGLPLEYEIESGKLKFKYSISKISFDPVLVSKFDFPKSGYNVMTYEENQRMKKGTSQ